MKKALVVYANGSEDMEVTAVTDILNRGKVKVIKAAVAKDGVEVTLAHGTKVICDENIASCNDVYDAIVIPGGLNGANNCRDCDVLIEKLKEQKSQKRIVAAICAAPGFVLAQKGIIDNERATGYPGCDGNIKNCTHKGVEVSEDKIIITGKGPAFAIPFALEILKALNGDDCMKAVASGMLLDI